MGKLHKEESESPYTEIEHNSLTNNLPTQSTTQKTSLVTVPGPAKVF